jgi:hypothetical protein
MTVPSNTREVLNLNEVGGLDPIFLICADNPVALGE